MVATSQEAHTVHCKYCNDEHVILADRKDMEAWLSGDRYIQDCLSYLTAGERELLISGTCDTCWKKMYPETLDEEE